MLGLDAQVLLHHRSMLGQIGGRFGRGLIFHRNRRMGRSGSPGIVIIGIFFCRPKVRLPVADG
jgi:hypothetical protein